MQSLALDSFVKVAYRCWDADPELRGNFTDILRDLEVFEDAYPAIVHDPKEETGLIAVDQVQRDLAVSGFCSDDSFTRSCISAREIWPT